MQARRFFLIGAGFIARAHAAALATLAFDPPPELHVASRSRASAEGFARQFPSARIHPDVPTLLRQPALPDDVVILSSPPATHRTLACDALRSGRHVLCEKPLALDRAEAMEMLCAAREAGRTLGCCSTRFLDTPAALAAKQYLLSGRLGKLYHATFVIRRARSRAGIDDPPFQPWYYDPAQGGGLLMDMGPYDFTTLNDLLRPVRVEVLAAWTARPKAPPHGGGSASPRADAACEQHAGAALRYHLADGAAVAVTYERAGCTHGAERSIVEIEGTTGAVRLDWPDWDQYGQVRFGYDEGGRMMQESLRPNATSSLRYDDKPLHYFVRHLAGLPSPAVVNEQAVFNFSCLRAVLDCAETGRPQDLSLSEFKP